MRAALHGCRGAALGVALAALACGGSAEVPAPPASPPAARPQESARAQLYNYASVELDFDRSSLGEPERAMLEPLAEACAALDEVFWLQVFGKGKDELLAKVPNPELRRYVEINYGPWDRLGGDRPLLPVLPRPAGGHFYPRRLQLQELETAMAASVGLAAQISSPFTVVERNEQNELIAVPYHQAFREPLERAAAALRRAGELSPHQGLRRYLELRARALLDGDYGPSAEAWSDTLDAPLLVVAGPLSRDEDVLRGYKLAFGGVVALPVAGLEGQLETWRAQLKELLAKLAPGRRVHETERVLVARDLVICTGDCSAGPKRVSLEPPENELARDGRPRARLLLPNVIRAKYEANLLPIVSRLIAPAQREAASYEAFLAQTAWHELAQGLRLDAPAPAGVEDRNWVVEATRSQALALRLAETLAEGAALDLEAHYVTYVSGLLRALRFGGMSAYGPASLAQLNYFEQQRAISRGSEGWQVDVERMRQAVRGLATTLVGHEAGGQHKEAADFIDGLRKPNERLDADLARLAAESVPIDVHFVPK